MLDVALDLLGEIPHGFKKGCFYRRTQYHGGERYTYTLAPVGYRMALELDGLLWSVMVRQH